MEGLAFIFLAPVSNVQLLRLGDRLVGIKSG